MTPLAFPVIDDEPATGPRILFRGEPLPLSTPSGDRLASIVIPVKNAGPGLRDLLSGIRRQRWLGRVELIAIDSSSEDETVDILREVGATVLSIEPRSYNHGLTRNLGASEAAGEVLVFVTQTGRPANDRWLANLVDAFEREPRLAGVSSRLLPHKHEDPLLRRDAALELSASPARQLRAIDDWERYAALEPHELWRFLNFHTIACAIRSEAHRQVPFRRTTTIGEDLAWARDALEAGFKLLHEPASTACHSHAYGFLELFARNFDDGVATREVVGRRWPDDAVLGEIAFVTELDARYLREECGLEGADLERWERASVSRRSAQLLGQWLGTNHDRLPPQTVSALSLTGRVVDPEALP